MVPNGVLGVPEATGVTATRYNADPDPELIARLGRIFEASPPEVPIASSHQMDEIARAHAALARPYVGTLMLTVEDG